MARLRLLALDCLADLVRQSVPLVRSAPQAQSRQDCLAAPQAQAPCWLLQAVPAGRYRLWVPLDPVAPAAPLFRLLNRLPRLNRHEAD